MSRLPVAGFRQIEGSPFDGARPWTYTGMHMDEIAFEVSRDEESGRLIASWDAPDGSGGITTQGEDLRDLQAQSSRL